MPGQMQGRVRAVYAALALVIVGIAVFVVGVVEVVGKHAGLGETLWAVGVALIVIALVIMFWFLRATRARTRDLQATQQATLREQFRDQPGGRLP